MVEVQIKDAGGNVIDTLHGLATSTDASGAATANITPLSEAVLAVALGQEDVTAHFASLSAGQASSLKTLDTTAAWSTVKAKITAVGIDVSSITTEPLSHVFTANSTGHDKVLDDLKTKGYTTEHLYRMGKNLPVPPTSATGLLNDTGIDWCTENITTPSTWVNNAVCSAINWVGNLWGQQQDAFFGRDAEARAGTLVKIGSGMVGFDFTRIGANGKPLKIQNATWSDTGNEAAGTKWDCVRDNVTGFWWEVKRNELVNGVKHLRHMDHRYAWYNPDTTTNGGYAGAETPIGAATGVVINNACTGLQDNTKCNTKAYAAAINSVGLCGKADWRLPNLEELASVMNLGQSNPAIDTNYFPNSPVFVYPFTENFSAYWTSTTFGGVSWNTVGGAAWLIYADGYIFDGGESMGTPNFLLGPSGYQNTKKTGLLVRLVR
jgi:hypothetical protein